MCESIFEVGSAFDDVLILMRIYEFGIFVKTSVREGMVLGKIYPKVRNKYVILVVY
jgi:hypothetical protein